MKNFLGELAVSLVLLALLFVLFNPSDVFMPTYLEMTLLAATAVLFGIFVNFVWREGSGDERERFHRMFADRIAFLTGSAALLIGIVVKEFERQSDHWLIAVLAAMIAAKVVGLVYTKIKS